MTSPRSKRFKGRAVGEERTTAGRGRFAGALGAGELPPLEALEATGTAAGGFRRPARTNDSDASGPSRSGESDDSDGSKAGGHEGGAGEEEEEEELLALLLGQ